MPPAAITTRATSYAPSPSNFGSALQHAQSRRAFGRGARRAGRRSHGAARPATRLASRAPGDVEDQPGGGQGQHEARPSIGDEGKGHTCERRQAEDREKVERRLRHHEGRETGGEQLAEAIASPMGSSEARVAEHAKKADEDEQRYYALARELGLKIMGEIGKKWPKGDRMRAGKGSVDVQASVSDTKRLLALGCEHVYLESRVIRDAIGDYGERQEGTRQISEIVEAVGIEKIFIEISGQIPFDTRQCHRFWAVRNFGPEVNMGGGGSIEEARYVEAIRRGITFVGGVGRSSSKLWIKSLANHGGKAAAEWWKEEFEVDPSLISASKI